MHEGRNERMALRAQEAAELCGVSAKTIYRLIEAGEIPIVEIKAAGARAIRRILPEDLNDWLRGHRRKVRGEDGMEQTTTVKPRFLRRPGRLDSEGSLRSSGDRSKGDRRP